MEVARLIFGTEDDGSERTFLPCDPDSALARLLSQGKHAVLEFTLTTTAEGRPALDVSPPLETGPDRVLPLCNGQAHQWTPNATTGWVECAGCGKSAKELLGL